MKVATLFHVSPVSGVPIYRQLMDQVNILIAGGRLAPGQRLPSVRELAEALEVNPMTVSKAYSLLQREGVIAHVRGHGMEVKEPEAQGSILQRKEALLPAARQLAVTAYQLALTRTQVWEVLEPLLDAPSSGQEGGEG